MRLINKALQKAYQKFNKMYFSNLLPKDIVTKFDVDGELDDAYGEYLEADKEILISEELRSIPDFAYIVLLHEMAHVQVPANNHGFQFAAVIDELYRKGAYDAYL